MKPDTIDDTELIMQLTCGNNAAFNIIYNRYAEHLLRFVGDRIRKKEESEEITQDLFEHLWRKRSSLEIASLRSYLFSAAKHKILNHKRHERVVERHKHETFELLHDIDNSTAESVELMELQERIELCINELPERCREAYCRSRMDHQAICEIAVSMNISTRTVENYITKALKHLKERLSDDF